MCIRDSFKTLSYADEMKLATKKGQHLKSIFDNNGLDPIELEYKLRQVFDQSFEHFQKADFAASILAIIGMVNLPIVKFSVDWWTTLHQGSSVFKVSGPSMTTDYLITLMVSFFAILLLSLYWFTNIFYIITENRRIERAKLLND